VGEEPNKPTVGEELNLRAVYDANIAFVWRNLRRLGVPEAQLDDAAQEVFLITHRRWHTFDASWSSLHTWLFGIVLRVAQNERRAVRRRNARFVLGVERELLEQHPSAAAGPLELLAKREAALLLEQALSELSDKARAILVLVDIEQLTVPHAAEALRLNVNTAYDRLRSARAQFQRVLVRVRATRGSKP
jgi:RNA polymerase sigma-70 factor (ECF subfamily)